ncbi:MAG: hypothetical protein KAS82_04380 [Bacteroidales bacterium]|nr:hypothetical protein [Bacteroidales bacterium]
MKKQGQAIRRMGFLKDQEGIMNRYIREVSPWENHLENSRNFIAGSFNQTEAESVAVLGSGWLLDVPLDHLIKRFKHIYLVDIHHPIQIRKKTAAISQVELIEEDLTGGAIEQIWQLCRDSKISLQKGNITDHISLKPPLEHIQPDALVSVNLLNQLDIILCDYIRKQGHFQQGSLTSFRAAIQAFHLEWISKKPGCLVTDTTEEVTDKNRTKSSKALLYTDLPDGIRHSSWWWDFDSLGTYHPGSRTRMEVRAVEWI